MYSRTVHTHTIKDASTMTITYTVQLRYDRTNFLGHGPIRPDGSHSVTFGTTDYLSKVLQFNSYVEALSTARSKYPNLSEDYVTITPFEQMKEETLYEVWITIPCNNGLRTYVLSGHNSFVPLRDPDPDLPALQWQTDEQATAYAMQLQLSSFKAVQVDTTF